MWAFAKAGDQIDESTVLGVLGIFIQARASSSKIYEILLSRLKSVQSLLRLLNVIQRGNEEKDLTQKQTLTRMVLKKLQSMNWEQLMTQELNKNQQVFLLKVLTKIQDSMHLQFEMVDKLVEQVTKFIGELADLEFEIVMSVMERRYLKDK